MSRRPPDTSGDVSPAWHQVDEGWGRRAVDFATLSEPSNCREYVALHHQLAVGPGHRLLDMACGAGLALELAAVVGATCSGIDASPRLIAVARDRNPHADLRVGDIQDLPWPDASFDVVTSFRGIWANDSRRLRRGIPRPGSRWSIGNHRLGSHQALPWCLVDGATGDGDAIPRLNTRRRWSPSAGQERVRSCWPAVGSSTSSVTRSPTSRSLPTPRPTPAPSRQSVRRTRPSRTSARRSSSGQRSPSPGNGSATGSRCARRSPPWAISAGSPRRLGSTMPRGRRPRRSSTRRPLLRAHSGSSTTT